MSSPTRAGTRIRSATCATGRTPSCRRCASRRPRRVAVVCGSSAAVPSSSSAAREHHVAARPVDRGSTCCSSVPKRATVCAHVTSECRIGERRDRCGPAPGAPGRGRGSRSRGRRPTPAARRRAGSPSRTRPGVAVEPVGLIGQRPSGGRASCGPSRIWRARPAQLLLLFGEGEVHWSRSCLDRLSGGMPGMPSPKIAIRSRCISLVPPPKVRMCMLAQYGLEPAAQHRAGRVALHRCDWSEDLHEQAERLQVELGAEHLDGRRVGRVERRRPASRRRRPSSWRAAGTRAWRAPGRG